MIEISLSQPLPAVSLSGKSGCPAHQTPTECAGREQFPAAKLGWGYFFQTDTKGTLTKEIVKWQRDQELQALDRNLEGLRVGEYTQAWVFFGCVCDRIVFKLHCDDICTTLKM